MIVSTSGLVISDSTQLSSDDGTAFYVDEWNFIQNAMWLFVVVGIIGNMLTLLVTTTKENRRISSCVYMAALSVVDTMVLVVPPLYNAAFEYGLASHWSDDTVKLYYL